VFGERRAAIDAPPGNKTDIFAAMPEGKQARRYRRPDEYMEAPGEQFLGTSRVLAYPLQLVN
jgi:hypothetical protein